MTEKPLGLIQIYTRSLGLLASEKYLAIGLASAGVVIAAIQLAEPILFGRVVDALSKGESAYGYIGLWALLGLFGIIAGVIVGINSDRLAHRQKQVHLASVFEKAIAIPQSVHAARGSGATIRTILAGTTALFWLWLGAMREQLAAIFGILLLIPTAISMDARMAMILFVLAAAYTLMNVIVMQRTAVGQAAVESHESGLSSRVVDVIGNVMVVQSYTRLSIEADALRAASRELLAAQYPVLTWWGILTVMQRSAATLTMVIIFVAGAVLVGRGELTVGQIVSFVAFATLLIARLDQLSAFVVRVHQQAPALTALFALMDEPAGTRDKPGAIPLPPGDGAVAFENVSFQYPGSAQGISDVSFLTRAGETTAIVGPTGSGKSTTIALLQRFQTPTEGRITIDGTDIANVTLDSLRRSISVVFQDAGLFNRSIGDNIRIGKPDATDAEVERASRLAEAHDFIMRKPEGYDFMIGERGLSLSGGERQRISIARAILKDAPILILDEATSALDSETEAKIKRALDTLRAGRTTFVIAHRLSTVADADQILVLDQGVIVERGLFNELAEGDGVFSRLVAEGGFTVPKTTETPPDEDNYGGA
ncbi:glucan ABC transporter ATP-binding protein/ permease [Hyphomicrobium methylovorum]|uniref:glucan ABC transporter ATP-binding protein/ permease n=1 Tax=Hyphomicrobium methylovorum TaxID=84 RepID=UPI0015E6F483|nr:glucan ABC transporter ATP-binding protein/ permease [Hyphomicrobium methylovorum]MBA2127651.1 glucan ABC transporter ATP-binding protein/ permease [Hyphomicrobium methylovorum]